LLLHYRYFTQKAALNKKKKHEEDSEDEGSVVGDDEFDVYLGMCYLLVSSDEE